MPRNTVNAERWTAFMFALVLPLISFTVLFVQQAPVSGYDTMGTLDAWIEGQVVNGETGMNVTCQTLKQIGGTPPQFITLYFNGTTDASGGFNITVDSDTWGSSPALNPYTVVIYSTYYKEAVTGSDLYTFSDHIFKGNTSSVPAGRLVARDFPTSNLTVRVINGSSGEPLEGAMVELAYRPGFPEPPFSLERATDTSGETIFPKIRSVNTSVEITGKNFKPLSETDPNDFIIVPEGGNALSTFTLTEKEWPFSVLLESTDVNRSLPIRIDFERTMHRDSILNVNNYGLFMEAGMLEVPFGLTSLEDDSMVDLQPLEDLEFNTAYNLRIEPYIMDNVGARPLWRAMTVSFTTELTPGAMIGRLVNSNTGDPADGLQVMVLDQISLSNVDGTFMFPSIPAGTYRMEVNESYLYNGTSRPGCVVEKGKVLDLGDVPIGPKSWGALRVRVTSDGSPLEGARVRIVDDMIREGQFDLLTGAQGEVFFPRVIAGAVTLEASAPHHNSVGDMAYVPISGEGGLDIDLKEDTFPVWVEAVDVDQGGNVLPGTNFLVHVSEPVKFSTLNITIWKEDDEGLPTTSVPLSIVAGQDEVTYIVDPDIRFPLESRFVLFISTELKALDDASFILWRELEFHFNTVDLPMILVNGTLLFEGKVIEGYRVDISYFHSFTDESGNFSVSVDPDEPTFKGVLEVNGSIFGYGNYKTDLELDAGSFLDSGTINLFHVPGWYEVYPAPDSEDVDPSTSVIFKFKEQILVPGKDRFSRLMSITQDGSRSPVDGNYDVSEDNRTITFKSINDLEPGKLYHVKISKDLMRWNNVSMFPLGNSTIFRVRPPVIQITVMEPSEDRDLPIDGIIRISFSHQVEKKEVEADISFSPIVQGVTFKWTSGSETMISAFFKVSTDYVLEVPSGSYGLEGETLTDDFLFSFKTSAGYENEHTIGDPQIFPSPDGGWAPGQNIRFSGIVANSTGYIITVKILKEGVTYREANSVISLEGRYSLNISAPSKEGKYTLSVSLSMPDGPFADEKTYDVQVGDAGSDSEPGDNTTRMIILAIIVLLVIAVIIVAVLYGRGQRAKAGSETMGIEYTEVETEWEDTEDEW